MGGGMGLGTRPNKKKANESTSLREAIASLSDYDFEYARENNQKNWIKAGLCKAIEYFKSTKKAEQTFYINASKIIAPTSNLNSDVVFYYGENLTPEYFDGFWKSIQKECDNHFDFKNEKVEVIDPESDFKNQYFTFTIHVMEY